ncbi:hypothetical protein RRG08_008598 [Elysia crispata]|uniref:Uncharacterized protein n=1 Tax=Elysia crispata TaxID=231223 RepID=A0AAE1B761_9GAST|nr:hypothetical protein RRG08_008598 [Elysia crispata]
MKVCTDVQPLYFHILINEFFVLVFDGVEKKKLGRVGNVFSKFLPVVEYFFRRPLPEVHTDHYEKKWCGLRRWLSEMIVELEGMDTVGLQVLKHSINAAKLNEGYRRSTERSSFGRLDIKCTEKNSGTSLSRPLS